MRVCFCKFCDEPLTLVGGMFSCIDCDFQEFEDGPEPPDQPGWEGGFADNH